MRLRIRHETSYTYETPAKRAIEVLRLTPRGYDGQFVVDWRIDVDQDCRLDQGVDPFGNTVHSFTVEGPLDDLTIVAEGQVETIRDQRRRRRAGRALPAGRLPARYAPDDRQRRHPRLRRQARQRPARLDTLHALMDGIREKLRFEVNATDTGTSATEAFALGHGVCQDFAHILIAACPPPRHPRPLRQRLHAPCRRRERPGRRPRLGRSR